MPIAASQPLRTSYATILGAIRDHLVDWPVLPEDRVKLLLQRSKIPLIQAEQMLFVRPGRYISQRQQRDGMGRVAHMIYRYARIAVVNRCALDPVDDDDLAMTDESRGIIPLEETAIDSLDLFWPEDDAGNALTFEPIRVISGFEEKWMAMKPFWADGEIWVEVGYLADLNQSVQ